MRRSLMPKSVRKSLKQSKETRPLNRKERRIQTSTWEGASRTAKSVGGLKGNRAPNRPERSAPDLRSPRNSVDFKELLEFES